MNVWNWKKSKIESNGWFRYYSSSMRAYVFVNNDFIIEEDIAQKMSLNTLNAIKEYNSDNLSYSKLLEFIDVERDLKALNFVELGSLKNKLYTLKLSKEQNS